MACQTYRATSLPALGDRKTVALSPLPLHSTPRTTLRRESRRFRTRLLTRAEELDFDAILIKVTEKFESAENKPVVIGYGVAALLALFLTEWLIHLPGLDLLLGFPIQLVGVLLTPVLVIRYVLDKEDWYGDAEGTVDKVASLLPGLKK